jgi:hypothetical protein
MVVRSQRSGTAQVTLPAPLRVLTPEQVMEVDRALAAIGPFGEVRLVKVKGRVRFIQQMVSLDLLQPSRTEDRERSA